jgi:hypothetical protein
VTNLLSWARLIVMLLQWLDLNLLPTKDKETMQIKKDSAAEAGMATTSTDERDRTQGSSQRSNEAISYTSNDVYMAYSQPQRNFQAALSLNMVAFESFTFFFCCENLLGHILACRNH